MPHSREAGLRREERARRIRRRLDADAGRDEIGLGVLVDRRRAARAERRHDIVAAIDRAEIARRADGQHPRRVAGRRDAAVLRLARRVAAEVAGGGDDDDAGVDGALGGERQRILGERLVDAGRDRQVDDADVERRRGSRSRSRSRR